MKQIVIANWKLYLSAQKSLALFEQLVRWEKKHPWSANLQIVIAPPMLALTDLARRLAKARSSKIILAAQDVGFADEGAFTGSVSPRDVRKLGVRYALVGHSERRQYFYEDAALCKKKLDAARAAGLKVVYCVGETKDERHSGRAQEIVREQLKGVRADIIAYEPRWAIGSGIAIEPPEAEAMHRVIAHQMGADAVICYGGSVTPENVLSFVTLENTAGVLVGSASSKLSTLTGIISKVDKRLS